MKRGLFISGVVAVCAAIVLAACGARTSGAAPSSLDPAAIAPASSLIYMDVTLRPVGAQRTAIETVLHKLFGPGVDAKLLHAFDKSLARHGESYAGDIQPWLGQRVGLVMTLASKTGVGVIAPTNDPSAARSFIAKLSRRNPGTTGAIVGHYAVFGYPDAVAAIKGAAGGSSLASTTGFSQAMSQLGADPAMRLYMRLKPYEQALLASPALAATGLGSMLRAKLAKVPATATIAAGASFAPSTVGLDVITSGLPAHHASGSAGDVGGLPATSWLALATGGRGFTGAAQSSFGKGFQLGMLSQLSNQGIAANPVASLLMSRMRFLEQEVLPALGPLTLSVGGASPLGLSVGLSLKPASLTAANKLLGMLRKLVARSPSLTVSGSATNFSVGLPTGQKLSVTEQAGQIVAIYGFPDTAAFLKPASTLSGNPAYRQALSQLPAGSAVPVYMSFAPITALVSLADHNASAAKVVRVLRELNYVIAGGTHGHIRLVLGLN